MPCDDLVDIAAEVQAKLADLQPVPDDWPDNPPVETVPDADRKETRAEAQGRVLRTAANDSPIRTLRYWLATMAREWERAAAAQREAPDEVAVEMVGALAPGSVLYSPGADGQSDLVVIRVMGPRDGQVSIHVEGNDGRPQYRNFLSLTSPVAVLR